MLFTRLAYLSNIHTDGAKHLFDLSDGSVTGGNNNNNLCVPTAFMTTVTCVTFLDSR